MGTRLIQEWMPRSEAHLVQLPSGLIVPEKSIVKRPKGIDLFCGVGGFSLGVMQAGFEVVAGVDNDPNAAITYMVNLGAYPMKIVFIEEGDYERLNKALLKDSKIDKQNKLVREIPVTGSGHIKHDPELAPVGTFFFGDVRKLTGERILRELGLKKGDLTCVFGGPPCQGFSTAGKQNVMDPRNSLVFEFARLVLELQPMTMALENVPGIVKMVTPEGIGVIDALCMMLSKNGYGTYDALKNSLAENPGMRAAARGGHKAGKGHRPERAEKQQESLSLF